MNQNDVILDLALFAVIEFAALLMVVKWALDPFLRLHRRNAEERMGKA